jgi:hypothetical protein
VATSQGVAYSEWLSKDNYPSMCYL